jgi:inner membrane protein
LDSITHIALGACLGEAMAGKQLGKKAMLTGVLAHSLPDIDFLAAFWLDTSDNLFAHRGLTHSFFFLVIMSPLLALFFRRYIKKGNISYQHWLFFFLVAGGLHLLLDALNNYGTGWFEPFNSKRVAFNVIFVADPFFSLFPGIAFLLLLFYKQHRIRKIIYITGLSASLLYTGYCISNKLRIEEKMRDVLAAQSFTYKRFMTTPAPFQNWLWFAIAETDSGYYTTYISVFDRNGSNRLSFFPRNENLLQEVNEKTEAKKLIRFSQGYYTLEKNRDTIVMNDLRFGQITGWDDPFIGFSFHYYLQPATDNKLVVQRGRFANWNKRTWRAFVRRIRGI